ncbi:MAG TPA: Fe-S protein assembly co-chaperone HscB [Rhodospirillales bacterium]|jgi:molecular chaperone HscB|nr:Fe-S protein assembly co-chaperone HscB [Rhodospirillales bacterium]
MQTQTKQVPVSRPADNSGIVVCWSCKGPVESGALFCPVCEVVQPPGQIDHFSRLGLEVSFNVNQKILDRRYFDLQRHLHPDRFATKTPRERALSQSQATSLNQAYEVLKDDLGRADYLIHLQGTDALPEGCCLINDQELLMESLELREALAKAKTAAEVDALAHRAAGDIETCVGQLSSLFADGDMEGACRLTTRLKYFRKLAEETRQAKTRVAGG